jgi:hypothetical protein
MRIKVAPLDDPVGRVLWCGRVGEGAACEGEGRFGETLG